MDATTIRKVSKKYSKSTTRHWARPPAEILSAIEGILIRNKAKALEAVPTRKLNTTNTALTQLMDDIMLDLQRMPLPTTMKLEDFDYDYLLKRKRALVNLHSNELTIVEKLEDTLLREQIKLKDLTKFLDQYEKRTLSEKKKLDDLIGDDSEISFKIKDQTGLTNSEKHGLVNDADDEVLVSLLQDLDNELERLDKGSSHLQLLSSKLDEMLDTV